MIVTRLAGTALSAAALCVLTALPASAGTGLLDDLLGGPAPAPSAPAPPPRPAIEPRPAAGPAVEPRETARPGDGAIAERYAGLPRAVRAAIGGPLGDEEVESAGLRWREYEHARFYWTPDTGVRIVSGAVLEHFTALGGHAVVGVPTTDELRDANGARYSEFAAPDGGRAAICFTPETGAHLLRGAVLREWRELGAGDALGYPTTDIVSTSDGAGADFSFADGASIRWSPAAGAHAIKGAIRDAWLAQGGAAGPLGEPASDERTADGIGRFQRFTGDGGRALIAWSPATGAHVVRGAIAERYAALGGPGGALGYPVSDEVPTADGRARISRFTGGVVVWSPAAGAVEVRGGVAQRWAQLGGERSYLGLPVRPERITPWGRRAEFERGRIDWYRGSGRVGDAPAVLTLHLR